MLFVKLFLGAACLLCSALSYRSLVKVDGSYEYFSKFYKIDAAAYALMAGLTAAALVIIWGR